MSAPAVVCPSKSKGGVKNTELINLAVGFNELFSLLSKPVIGEKDGRYFCIVPVSAARRSANDNITSCSLVVLGGDSRIDAKTGKVIEGAPQPKQVHKALCNLGIQHINCTSHNPLRSTRITTGHTIGKYNADHAILKYSWLGKAGPPIGCG